MIVSYISYVIVMCTINHFAKNLGTQAQKSQRPNFIRVVEVTGLEPATAWSQTRNATNCATPRFRFAGAKVRNKNEK